MRTPSEFNESHIGGALLIPLSELENRLEELDKDKKIIVYCRSGRRSADACAILAEHGFDAYNMLGGILAWERSGAPGSSF
ncbi:MAG: Rhodanese-related sulfurtransferase [Candidatus Alkanophagales archaeon MCA70_species_2]|nr:Rhodanese-related sulfurtransferase [Candidatus Alkanophaga liquidiphilum]